MKNIIVEHIYILSLADIIKYIKSKPIYSMKELHMLISYDDFEKVDLRSGTITKVEEFARAKKPSYKIWVDFGPEIGIKQTSAQITVHYKPENLIGKMIVGCTNLGEKNIAGFTSQFLLCGFADQNGAVSAITVDPKVPNGQKLF